MLLTFGLLGPGKGIIDRAIRALPEIIRRYLESFDRARATDVPVVHDVFAKRQHATRWHNKRTKRRGNLWEETFPRNPLWSHWGGMVTIVVLLGIFWAGRKLSGGF